ncbi:MAG: hypothetical protein IH599_10005 [Bacteroidales bacterium]|nr:hypothetical protein [Bacteroidales bacterium]
MRFELAQLTETIASLQEMKISRQEAAEAKLAAKAEAKAEAKAAKTKRKPGRPATKKPAKRGRKPRRTKGYRLSDWDNFLVELIRENQKPMTSSELLEAATLKAPERNIAIEADQIKGKVARSLQKLANKRGVLGKASSRGKGYVYGVAEWFFARSGRLKKSYEV